MAKQTPKPTAKTGKQHPPADMNKTTGKDKTMMQKKMGKMPPMKGC